MIVVTVTPIMLDYFNNELHIFLSLFYILKCAKRKYLFNNLNIFSTKQLLELRCNVIRFKYKSVEKTKKL